MGVRSVLITEITLENFLDETVRFFFRINPDWQLPNLRMPPILIPKRSGSFVDQHDTVAVIPEKPHMKFMRPDDDVPASHRALGYVPILVKS